jgi:hypothetical protein
MNEPSYGRSELEQLFEERRLDWDERYRRDLETTYSAAAKRLDELTAADGSIVFPHRMALETWLRLSAATYGEAAIRAFIETMFEEEP